eukprot:15367044-Ditylum_brightwellii.AAC.2
MGVATAYCGIVGYIHTHDFAVANSCSQPPATVGKSDYYVQVDDISVNWHTPNGLVPCTNDGGLDYLSGGWYTTVLGKHIYRPAQAAVTVTNQ